MPLRPPTRGPLTQADTLFQTVLDNATAARTPSPGRQPWISQATWTLIDQRIAIRRAEPFDQAEYRRTSRRIKQSLAADRKKRVEQAGADIEGYLSAPEPDLKAAWGALQAWYRHAGDRPHKPSRQDLEVLTAEREDLYRQRDPPGEPIPVHRSALRSEGRSAVRRGNRRGGTPPTTGQVPGTLKDASGTSKTMVRRGFPGQGRTTTR